MGNPQTFHTHNTGFFVDLLGDPLPHPADIAHKDLMVALSALRLSTEKLGRISSLDEQLIHDALVKGEYFLLLLEKVAENCPHDYLESQNWDGALEGLDLLFKANEPPSIKNVIYFGGILDFLIRGYFHPTEIRSIWRRLLGDYSWQVFSLTQRRK